MAYSTSFCTRRDKYHCLPDYTPWQPELTRRLYSIYTGKNPGEKAEGGQPDLQMLYENRRRRPDLQIVYEKRLTGFADGI